MKSFTFYISVLLFAMVICSCDNEKEVILDVKALKGKTHYEVTKIIGKPDSTYTKYVLGDPFFIQVYRGFNHAELRYANDTINSVLITKPYDLPFKPEVIARFGLPVIPPFSKDTSAFYNWKNLDGLANISVYKIGSKMPKDAKVNYQIYFDMK